MKVVGKTTYRLTIDPSVFLHSGADRRNFHYLIDRLCSGEETAVENLETWGITITEDEFVTIPRMD